MSESSSGSARVRIATTPGGLPRHFRVQILQRAVNEWRFYALFRNADLAERCCEFLRRSGMTARVVHCNRVPSAA